MERIRPGRHCAYLEASVEKCLVGEFSCWWCLSPEFVHQIRPCTLLLYHAVGFSTPFHRFMKDKLHPCRLVSKHYAIIIIITTTLHLAESLEIPLQA